MRAKILILFSFLILFLQNARSQEFQANVTVLSNRINTSVNKQIFTTLQNALYNWINGRKWTNVAFSNNEKIQCSFLRCHRQQYLYGTTDHSNGTDCL